MAESGLAHSPLALMLLDLARRQASGSVRLGDRTVVVRRGAVANITPGEGDQPLEEFLIQAGRVTAGQLEQARSGGEDRPPAEALVANGHLSEDALRHARRAQWLDRLIRSLGVEADPVFEPEAPGAPTGSTVNLVPLVLDALDRRAAQGDAQVVGTKADHLLQWENDPLCQLARKWSELGEGDRIPVSRLLSVTPSAPSRIAAVVRAGLARLSRPQSAPPPPRRQASLAPPGRGSRPPPTTGSSPPRHTSLPPPREPRLNLDPGAAPAPDLPQDLAVAIWRPPVVSAPLEDPLDPLEREVAQLEEAEAPGTDRAKAWRAVARVWQREYGALEEAARAWREAAHADARDRAALDEASMLCAAMGRSDLARSYAQAQVAVAEPGPVRARALRRLAEMCLRVGEVPAAAEALERATREDPTRADSAVWLVRLCRSQGDLNGAVRWARDAASRLRERRPGQARALLAWAATLRPDDVDLLEDYGSALSADGFDEAAVSLLAEAARATPDADERRRLLLDAAERAESAGRPDLAAERMLEAFDAEPHADVLHEPLAADMSAAGDMALTAVVLEEVAEVALPEQRADWLLRAADAHANLPGAGGWAEELMTRALVLDPGSRAAVEALRSRADALRDPSVLTDALERAARRAMVDGRPEAAPLLRELAPVAYEELGSAPRALWAWECLAGLEASAEDAAGQARRLRSEMGVAEELVAEAQRELDVATPAERAGPARKLATTLRDHPDEAGRAIALYREALDADPDDAVAASSLEHLLRRRGDLAGTCELLRRRSERATDTTDRVRHLMLLACFEWARGHFRACSDACTRVLDLDPHHLGAVARLDRAGRRLDDPEVRHRAIEVRAASATAPRARARSLVALSQQLEQLGAIQKSIEIARRAATSESRPADASALLLRHLEWLGPGEALQAVDNARAAMGDSPPLLELATQIAERAGDTERAELYLDAWAGLMPGDPRVTRWRLTLAVKGEDTRRIVSRAEEALSPDVIDELPPSAIRRAIARLDQLGAVADAAQVAILAADRIGHRDAEVLSLAERLAESGGRVSHRIAALERRVAHADRTGRAAYLRQLADLHREHDSRAAEARTLLRLLADEPYDAVALERLADIYAETGENERLLAVLAVRLDGARQGDQRQRALLDLASAAALSCGDLDRATGFLRGLVDEAEEGDREAARNLASAALVSLGQPVRAVELLLAEARKADDKQAGRLCERAVAIAERAAEDPALALRTSAEGLAIAPRDGGLLVSFERLALGLGDVATARSTYDALAGRAMGPHGRRALRYREARWLEHAGDLPAALAAFGEAFQLQPGGGVVFQSIDRIATELAEWEPLVDACLALAERTPNIDHRVDLTRRATGHIARDLDDPARAFEVLFDAWQQTGRMVLLPDLRSLGAQAGEGARDRIVAQLREWIEQTWDGDAKVDFLSHIARIQADDGEDMAAAGATLEQVVELVDDEDVPNGRVADVLCEWAERLRERGEPDRAAHEASRALSLAPEHEGAHTLLRELRPDHPEGGAERRPPSTPPAADPSPDHGPPEMHELATLSEEPDQDADEGALRAAADDGDLDAGERLGCILAGQEARRREALQVLLGVAREDPSRTLALRVLLDVAHNLEAWALADTVAAVLSMFDPAVEAPAEDHLVGLGRQFEELTGTLHDQAPSVAVRALAMVWEQAPHLFRRRIQDYGLVGTDRVADTGPRPLSQAYGLGLELVQPGEVALFTHRTDPQTLWVVPTQPPSVVAPLEGEREPTSLFFRVGRGLELARAEHLLVGVLEPEALATLLKSLEAAFGPADSTEDVSREAAELASELWRTVPPRAQNELRDLLGEATHPFDPEAIRASVHRAAVRAGLAVGGGVVAAVAGLLWDDPSLANASPDTEAGYAAACQQSPALVELLRFALSDDYLAARTAALT